MDVCPDQNFTRVLFSCPETTYRDEIARKALLSRGAKEVFIHRWSECRFSLWSTHREGWETHVAYPGGQSVKSADLSASRKQIAERLSGKHTYIYMPRDVLHTQTKFRRQYKNSGFPHAVLYLHLVTDAQHAWGPDCFNDLHHWLRISIKLLLQNGFRVFLKLHPLCVNPRLPGDAKYRNYLERWLGSSWDELAFGEILPSKHSGIFLVDYRVPVAAMRDLVGDFLCITHHGVIATEAIALRIPVAMSCAGPYRHFPPFAFTYESVGQYENFLKRYVKGELKVTLDMENNLYFYLASTRTDYNRWLWATFGELSGKPFFEDPEATYKLMRQIEDDADIPELLRRGFGGSRPTVNIDGIDLIRRDALNV
jgi:hypothetical protein